MTICYFCCKNETSSYWSYYCGSCIKIKSFCKLVSPEKLVSSLQFQINKSTVKEINQDVKQKLEELGLEINEPRKSNRLKNKYDMDESLRTTSPPAPPPSPVLYD